MVNRASCDLLILPAGLAGVNSIRCWRGVVQTCPSWANLGRTDLTRRQPRCCDDGQSAVGKLDPATEVCYDLTMHHAGSGRSGKMKIGRVGLTDRVHEKLKELILDQELGPGTY